ncbi:hypothetical protein ACFXKG_18540 [Streptomyces sp. NPDC059255]|uniref:hypothetical protein n=1 Tax=Streptomyces sp. NPDC059255 TaxID=3346793 RepID=UPI0036CB049F
MARVRYIGPEPVTVPELGGRQVDLDEVVEVPDDRYEGYVCQPAAWESVEEPTTNEPAPVSAPLKKAAGRTAPKGADL